MTFTIKENPDKMNIVQAVFNEKLASLTQNKIDTIVQTLELLLHSQGKYKVKVISLLPQADTG